MQSKNPLEADPTLANRYLAGQLSDADLDAFEASLDAQPELVRDLEAAARFKVGLAKLRDTGQLDVFLEPPQRSYRWLAVAAAVVALAVGVVLVRVMTASPPVLAASLSQLSREGTPPSVAATLAMYVKRGSPNQQLVLVLPPSRQAIRLRVLPSAGAQPPYQIAVSGIDSQGGDRRVASIEVAQLDEDGFATVYADSARLEPGRYSITVSGRGGMLETRFTLEVRRTAL